MMYIFNMNAKIQEVIDDINNGIDKLDALRAGQSTDAGFLIERTIGDLEEITRYELTEIEKAL
jgi:hypothetical protein